MAANATKDASKTKDALVRVRDKLMRHKKWRIYAAVGTTVSFVAGATAYKAADGGNPFALEEGPVPVEFTQAVVNYRDGDCSGDRPR